MSLPSARQVMLGFDGDHARAASVRTALAHLLDVFPLYLEKPRTMTWFEPTEVAMNQRFDAIVRAHKQRRLDLPIGALSNEGAMYHGFTLMHLRRLAWFVPSLLAAWLDAAPTAPFGRCDARMLARILADTEIVEGPAWAWTADETVALEAFFAEAILAAVATPLTSLAVAEAEAAEVMQRKGADPLESLERAVVVMIGAHGRASETVELASAMHVPTGPILERWMAERTRLADDHLRMAFRDDPQRAARLLAHPAVLVRLEEAFFTATGDEASRLSVAAELVRSSSGG